MSIRRIIPLKVAFLYSGRTRIASNFSQNESRNLFSFLTTGQSRSHFPILPHQTAFIRNCKKFPLRTHPVPPAHPPNVTNCPKTTNTAYFQPDKPSATPTPANNFYFSAIASVYQLPAEPKTKQHLSLNATHTSPVYDKTNRPNPRPNAQNCNTYCKHLQSTNRPKTNSTKQKSIKSCFPAQNAKMHHIPLSYQPYRSPPPNVTNCPKTANTAYFRPDKPSATPTPIYKNVSSATT